jgi:nitroimidazol reductase NimA-like FMN-containing flavoprotein (pyridoxamine 5'-phosphate oxidase superfamily)
MSDTLELAALLKRLFAAQRFGVLATQSGGQPYGTLVTFAETPDLAAILFVTGRNTRKYSDVMGSSKVAVVVDSRMNRESDFRTAVAVTATGEVEEVAGGERDRLAEVYLSKHPTLSDFVGNPTNALMKIGVAEYVIASFDRVQRFRPDGL